MNGIVVGLQARLGLMIRLPMQVELMQILRMTRMFRLKCIGQRCYGVVPIVTLQY